jgi:hypothetical protein
MGGVIMQEIVVPGFKMDAVLVGVPYDSNQRVMLFPFGVRKEDRTISTRFSTIMDVSYESTSLGNTERNTSGNITDVNRLRKAVRGRVARNFFRKVLTNPDFIANPVEYYQNWIESKWCFALEGVIATSRERLPMPKMRFPTWTLRARTNVDGREVTYTRTMMFLNRGNVVAATYEFKANYFSTLENVVPEFNSKRFPNGTTSGTLSLTAWYPDLKWEKAEDFIARHLPIITGYLDTVAAVVEQTEAK